MTKQNKLKKAYSLDVKTVELVEKNAKKQDRSKSSVVNRTLKENLK